MRRGYVLTLTLVLSLFLLASPIAVARETPTYKLAVKDGDWAVYEVMEAVNVTVYDRGLKPGDRLKYQLSGRELGNMTTWWGELIAYVERPLCDIWLNGEKVASNAQPTPPLFNVSGFGPFWPASDSFWQDCKRWFNASESMLAFTIQEYQFNITEDHVSIILSGKAFLLFAVIQVSYSLIIDRDTGVVRKFKGLMPIWSISLAEKKGKAYYSKIILKLIDTNVNDAWPKLIPTPALPLSIPPEFTIYLSIGSLILAIVALAISIKRH